MKSSIRTCLCASLALLALPGSASAEVLTVGPGGDYHFKSVQSAVNAAGSGDVIEVAAGYYLEGSRPYRGDGRSSGLNFELKSDIVLLGAGAEQTTLDLDRSWYGLLFDGSHRITVSGFTVLNARHSSISDIDGSSENVVEDCVFGGELFAPSNGVQDPGDPVYLRNVVFDASSIDSVDMPRTRAGRASLLRLRFGHWTRRYEKRMGLKGKTVIRFGQTPVRSCGWVGYEVWIGENGPDLALVTMYDPEKAGCRPPRDVALHEACHRRMQHHLLGGGFFGAGGIDAEAEAVECQGWYRE